MTEKYKQKDTADEACKLGSFLSEYLEKQIAPRQSQWLKITKAWNEAVPVSITRMCSITGFEDGVLTVGVVSQAYANEIRLITKELMEILNVNLGRNKIHKIRTILKQGS